jgi:hypothetical protein
MAYRLHWCDVAVLENAAYLRTGNCKKTSSRPLQRHQAQARRDVEVSEMPPEFQETWAACVARMRAGRFIIVSVLP